MEIRVTDQLDRTFCIPIGLEYKFKPVREFLTHFRIPSEIVIVRSNDKIVTEDVLFDDTISLEIVRHLDLPKLLTIPRRKQKTTSPVFNKRTLSFDFKKDDLVILEKEFSKEEFVKYFEDTVLQTMKKYDMFKGKVGVALSGGKDSVAMLLALNKLKDKSGNMQITAYTLEGWGQEQKNTYEYARTLPKKLGLPHKTASIRDVQKVFNLNTDYETIFKEIATTNKITQNEKTMILAATQRRLVEWAAQRDGIFNLYFGLNKEDLMSEIILTYTTGHLAFPLPVRPVKPFTYFYPLAFISKKETGLYLYISAPEYTHQEPSSNVETGAKNAQFHVKLCNDLTEIWPGIEYSLFNAYAKITSHMQNKINLVSCENCGSTIVKTDDDNSPFCGACKIYKKLGFLDYIKYDIEKIY